MKNKIFLSGVDAFDGAQTCPRPLIPDKKRPCRKTRKLQQEPLEFAAEILGIFKTSPLPLQALVDARLARACISGLGAGLPTELSYGVVRMEIRLRLIEEHFFPRPGRLPPRVRQLLITAVYAVLFLDKSPVHAIVDRAVESVKRRYGSALARVINGGLRAVCRDAEMLKELAWYTRYAGNERKALALYYALPFWLYELWETAYGPERAALFAAKSSRRPAIGIRVNRTCRRWNELAAQLEGAGAVRMSESALALAPGVRPTEETLPLACLELEGRLSRQGVGSQLALEALRSSAWPEPIWDACAGQGTKSCALLEQGKKLQAASDIYLPRLRRIASECQRLGLAAPPVFSASLLRPPLRVRPKTILLDAPCSGLGVLSARPDIRHRRTPGDVRDLVRLQAEMLNTAADFLPSGGKLAYITCTLNPAENEEQVRRLCRLLPKMKAEIEWNSPAGDPLVEGMYAALLVKA